MNSTSGAKKKTASGGEIGSNTKQGHTGRTIHSRSDTDNAIGAMNYGDFNANFVSVEGRGSRQHTQSQGPPALRGGSTRKPKLNNRARDEGVVSYGMRYRGS